MLAAVRVQSLLISGASRGSATRVVPLITVVLVRFHVVLVVMMGLSAFRGLMMPVLLIVVTVLLTIIVAMVIVIGVVCVQPVVLSATLVPRRVLLAVSALTASSSSTSTGSSLPTSISILSPRSISSLLMVIVWTTATVLGHVATLMRLVLMMIIVLHAATVVSILATTSTVILLMMVLLPIVLPLVLDVLVAIVLVVLLLIRMVVEVVRAWLVVCVMLGMVVAVFVDWTAAVKAARLGVCLDLGAFSMLHLNFPVIKRSLLVHAVDCSLSFVVLRVEDVGEAPGHLRNVIPNDVYVLDRAIPGEDFSNCVLVCSSWNSSDVHVAVRGDIEVLVGRGFTAARATSSTGRLIALMAFFANHST